MMESHSTDWVLWMNYEKEQDAKERQRSILEAFNKMTGQLNTPANAKKEKEFCEGRCSVRKHDDATVELRGSISSASLCPPQVKKSAGGREAVARSDNQLPGLGIAVELFIVFYDLSGINEQRDCRENRLFRRPNTQIYYVILS